MRKTLAFACLVFSWSFAGVRSLAAQDLVITNARIVVGNGNVIDQGSIVIRGGRIASVAAGRADASGVLSIDAKGMTAIPGLIDAHRHVNTGPDEKQQM